MNMKKIIFLLLLIFNISLISAKENPTENERLETLCKVWGFLKYYHPNVAKGQFDWDNQLIQKIKESEKTETKNQFNKMISEWIDGLGKVEKCTKCNEKNDKKYFLKNFDLSWTDDETVFSKDVIEKLNFIEENRNTEENYYAKKTPRTGQIQIENEKEYSEKFPDKEIRLLNLFRYWNLIEYFFPYKYQTDQNWNDVLKEMIPKIKEAKDRKEYLLAFAETVSKINDSHGYFMVVRKNMFYGNSQIPAEAKFVENQLLVTDFYSTKTSYNQTLQKFDIITKIDGKTPEEIQNYYSKYIPASNRNVLLRKISDLYLYSFKDKITIEILRNNQPLQIEMETVKFSDINYPKAEKPTEKWKLIDDKTGYVNMGILEKKDVGKMYNELNNTSNIIFDIRNYPKGTAYPIMQLLSNEKKQFCDFIRPDFSYPGKYYYEDKQEFLAGNINNNEPYKGSIIILVNETTQSHAEFSTMILQVFPNAKVIGSQTSGADGNVTKFDISGIHTSFTGLGVFYPDGGETQRIGIVPDIEVKPTVKGIREGRDEVLERALGYIKNGK